VSAFAEGADPITAFGREKIMIGGSANKTIERKIVVTTNAEDIPLILLDNVEAVILRRKLPAAVKEAAKAFDPSAIDRKQQVRRASNYIDKGRVLLSEKDREYRRSLKPFWDDRRVLSKTFRENLKISPERTFLMVQKPFRKGARAGDELLSE
jgi:hypothetical protein